MEVIKYPYTRILMLLVSLAESPIIGIEFSPVFGASRWLHLMGIWEW
jgi:hypothetical protein